MAKIVMVKSRGIRSKSELAIILSTLKGFYEGEVRLEQYSTDSETAADMLWKAYLLGDIKGRVIADLGCGTGILGIGACLLGAKKVYFADIDKNALETTKVNVAKVKSECSYIWLRRIDTVFIYSDIGKFNKSGIDTVLQNPPFGTKTRHKDVYFLEKAIKVAKTGYSFHKSETLNYLNGFLLKRNVRITHIWDFKLPLKQTYKFHRSRIKRINVACIRFTCKE